MKIIKIGRIDIRSSLEIWKWNIELLEVLIILIGKFRESIEEFF